MAKRDFASPGFRLALMRKDLGLALDEAGRLGVPMPVTAASHEVLTQAVQAGLGELDCAAVLSQVERMAGIGE
jgi:3-hydroxyisobutyrate dehydrogenase